ncbi:MAG: alfa-L-rhamnosidase, partial [Planctomycetes bacterium]|nr:alfa-L-rhamnosidase [Planctomycetota bacterium]
VLHSDTPLASSFECTDPMVNRLFQNVVWTQRANFIDLPTDCPQRDERMGWTGDAQVYIGTAAYNADVGAFYTKWLRELMESQRPSGAFPGYAPFPFQHGWDFGTAWADAGIICPWTVWQAYGDTSVIRTCWAPMTRFMEWRKATSRDGLGINHGNEWGDWLAQGEVTPIDYIDTVYFAITSRLMSEMAAAIQRPDEQAAYERQFETVKAAFSGKYVKEDGSLLVDTQTAYALALDADLIPDQMRRATGEILARKIQQNGTRMATGFLGTRPLLPVLSSVGQHDLAAFLFQSREFPSWGYEVEQGATTIWERWDSFTKEEGFGRHNAAMNSFSHYAFGAVCEWMFQSLAGIRSDGPGYRKIIIRPMPPSPGSNAERQPIDWVKASHDAITGRIVSHWRIQDKRFELVVSIPANTSATVFVPATSLEKVTERDAPIADAPHVRFLRMESGRAVLEVESGDYHFASQDAIARAGSAFKTSERPDVSANPQNVDLANARVVARWDFTKPDDVAAWSAWHNLSAQQRDGSSFLVATGDDPQMEIRLAEPLSGRLAVKLEAQPAKGTNAQFFWASATGHFSPQATNARALNPATGMKEYLFKIESDGPVQKLRFDPFPNQGEMRVQAMTLFQLPD